jgi:hypothetical protein
MTTITPKIPMTTMKTMTTMTTIAPIKIQDNIYSRSYNFHYWRGTLKKSLRVCLQYLLKIKNVSFLVIPKDDDRLKCCIYVCIPDGVSFDWLVNNIKLIHWKKCNKYYFDKKVFKKDYIFFIDSLRNIYINKVTEFIKDKLKDRYTHPYIIDGFSNTEIYKQTFNWDFLNQAIDIESLKDIIYNNIDVLIKEVDCKYNL